MDIIFMLYMPSTLHQLRIPQQYLKTLPQDNENVRYRNSKSVPEIGFFQKIKILLWPSHYYTQLTKFYPCHPIITQSKKTYDQDHSSSLTLGGVTSIAIIFGIHQFARRGKVLPLLRRYGQFFKTHRISRHYLWALILPVTLLQIINRFNHFDNLVQLQGTHARRIYYGQLNDPEGTVYPQQFYKLDSFGNSWVSGKYAITDLKLKNENEGPLQNSTDYENPQFEAVDIGQGEKQEEAQGEEQE